MAGYEGESEPMWDEYDWERFLQQQDHKTEQYMQLLEKYLDDPQRDQIIAREVGWTQLLEEREWQTEGESLWDEETTIDSALGTHRDPSLDTLEDHNLYRAAFALTV